MAKKKKPKHAGSTIALNKKAGHDYHIEQRFEAGSAIDLGRLKEVGLAPKKARFLKILGWGEVTKSFQVKAHAVSDGAREKLEAASGTIELLETRPTPRPRGVKKPNPPATDRQSED